MEDGIFYISYRDFMDAFGTITICYIHDDWEYSTFEIINYDKTNKQLEFEIP